MGDPVPGGKRTIRAPEPPKKKKGGNGLMGLLKQGPQNNMPQIPYGYRAAGTRYVNGQPMPVYTSADGWYSPASMTAGQRKGLVQALGDAMNDDQMAFANQFLKSTGAGGKGDGNGGGGANTFNPLKRRYGYGYLPNFYRSGRFMQLPWRNPETDGFGMG